MTINERIFYIMNEKGLKQNDLAKSLDLPAAQITVWKKRGTTPPAEHLINICKFLDISIYELLGEPKNDLSAEEKQLLYYFRQCSDGNKLIILNAAQGLMESKEEKSSTLKIG